jgi:hypothetical protein
VLLRLLLLLLLLLTCPCLLLLLLLTCPCLLLLQPPGYVQLDCWRHGGGGARARRGARC